MPQEVPNNQREYLKLFYIHVYSRVNICNASQSLKTVPLKYTTDAAVLTEDCTGIPKHPQGRVVLVLY